MAHTFDLEHFIDRCRKVKGAVTIANAMDLLSSGQEIFILLNTSKNVAVVRGEVLFVQHHVSSDEPDVKVTLEFRKAEIELGVKKKHVSPVILGEMLNGKSPYIGDEANGNVSRLFVLEQDAIDYFEIVKFVRQLNALERASDVNGLITRLLKKPGDKGTNSN